MNDVTNITTEVKGQKLHIIVDVSPKTLNNAPLSSTGKTRLIATSHGNYTLDTGVEELRGVTIGLNVFRKVNGS